MTRTNRPRKHSDAVPRDSQDRPQEDPQTRRVRVHDDEHHHGHDDHDHADHEDQPSDHERQHHGQAHRQALRQHTVRVDLPVVLPTVHDEADQCIDRLRESISRRRGIREMHIDNAHGRPTLCLHYDPDETSLSQVTRAVEKSGAVVTRRFQHESLWVRGMESGECRQKIENVLTREPGVLAASVNYAAERARVEYDTSKTSRKRIVRAITRLGYRVEDVPGEHAHDHDHDGDHAHSHGGGLTLPLLSGLFLALGYAGETLLPIPEWAVLTAYAIAYVAGGYDIARHGVRSVLSWTFDIEVLMLVAATGAALLGHYAEGGLLLFLFSLGHALEHMAMDKARNAIGALGKLTPKTARAFRDGREREIAVGDLLRGDLVVVRPGERVPIDGRVREGRSALDQSPITGESVPVEKAPGDEVYAGTVNGENALRIEVTRLARDTTLARVVAMVEEAQTQKSPTQRFAERFEARFVPSVLVLVVGVALLPPLIGTFASSVPFLGRLALPWSEAFLRSMTILVAASPCALAISTPAAVLSGIAQGARNGVLFKGGAHLENLGNLRAIAFDKTGTITHGRPEVREVVPLNGTARAPLLSLVAAVESHSTHPLARAIVEQAHREELVLPEATGVQTTAGRGIQGRVGERRVRVGNLKLFTDDARPVPAKVRDEVRALEQRGHTCMLVEIDDKLAGIIGLADTPRPDARQVMTALRARKVEHLVMLTGDNATVARAIADEVGIREVEADLLPEQKAETVKRLTREHGMVAMVGDGINDAPAMANATLGIAMGAGGTDVALETADVALMSDNLGKLPYALGLSRKSNQIIRQNLFLSLGVVALLLPTALLGIAGIGIAIVLHEGSTLLVAANALRLLRYREDSL